jgi:hypothetical protein
VSDRGAQYDVAQQRLIARLSEARGDIQDLRALLEPMQHASSMPGESELERVQELLEALAGRLPEVDKALAESPRLDAQAARPVEQLGRIVAAAQREAEPLNPRRPPASIDAARMAALGVLGRLDGARATMLDLIAPYQVREQLHGLRVGRALLLTSVLSDEPLTAEERRALLQRLESDSVELPEGVVDIDHERVWRKSSSQVARVASYLTPVIVAVIAGAALALAPTLGLDDSVGLESSGDNLNAYLLVLVGMVAHLLIENLKQFQANTTPVAIGAFLDWLHLRWVAIAYSFVPVVVTVVGLLATVGFEGDKALLYFFAGYSIDSVAGVFLTRFGTAAASGVAKVQELIGAAPPRTS